MRGTLHFIGTVNKAGEEEAEIEICKEFCAALKNLEDFSHLIVLYWMHKRDDEKNRQTLLVLPRRHFADVEIGVFACRSPSRPNPIGFCIVELLRLEECLLLVKGLDALEGSPILDIKPYLPKTDSVENARVPNWMSHGPKT